MATVLVNKLIMQQFMQWRGQLMLSDKPRFCIHKRMPLSDSETKNDDYMILNIHGSSRKRTSKNWRHPASFARPQSRATSMALVNQLHLQM